MNTQNYKNHSRIIVLYHVITLLAIFFLLIASIVHIFSDANENLCLGMFGLISSLILASLFFFTRAFALKAQDRAIRSEENFRHFLLTQKPLDARLSIQQVIGLRFASDEEFPALAQKAANENLSQKEIKIAIVNWRADHYRV
jgi:hypothetical protein